MTKPQAFPEDKEDCSCIEKDGELGGAVISKKSIGVNGVLKCRASLLAELWLSLAWFFLGKDKTFLSPAAVGGSIYSWGLSSCWVYGWWPTAACESLSFSHSGEVKPPYSVQSEVSFYQFSQWYSFSALFMSKGSTAMTSFSFLTVVFVPSLLLLVSLAKGLSNAWIFSKNQLLISFVSFLYWLPVFNFVDFCSNFYLGFLLFTLDLIFSSFVDVRVET